MSKRPLGLGSLKANKVAKTEESDNGDNEVVFQMPEGDMSEEAELKTLYVAAEGSFNDYKSLEEDELEEDEKKSEDESLRHRAEKLLSGVIHECDRLLKLHDARELEGKAEAEVYEIMGDALFKLRCLDDITKVESNDEYVSEALGKLEAGLEDYPEHAGLKYSHGTLLLFKALQEGEDLSKIIFPTISQDDLQANIVKVWNLALFFFDVLEEPEQSDHLCKICIEIVPDEAQLGFELNVQFASIIARYIEGLLEAEEPDSSLVSKYLAKLESILAGDGPDVEDVESQTTFGELKAKYFLLLGSMHAVIDEDEVKEQEAYQQALEVFQKLHETYGVHIPDYILEITN